MALILRLAADVSGAPGNIAAVTTSSRAAPHRPRGSGSCPLCSASCRFSHTIFALPFAFAAAVLARMEVPRAAVLWWITIAMVGARSLAMALNRLIDADIDARNPRTAEREIPSGRLTVAQVGGFCAVSLAVLLLAVSQLPQRDVGALADPGGGVRDLPLHQALHLDLPHRARAHDRPGAGRARGWR